MALARGPYLEHLRAALRHALATHPELINPLLQGLLDFVTQGPVTIGGAPTTLANRREAARILAVLIWRQVLGQPYSGHAIKHWLAEAGVPVASLEEVPQLEEPPV